MDITEVIRQGIITEKSVDLQHTSRDVGRNRGPKTGEVVPRYTFKVALEANKYQIKQAVEELFNVKVVRVNTMRMPGKAKALRTRTGIQRAEARPWKKAIVTLAEGQVIEGLQEGRCSVLRLATVAREALLRCAITTASGFGVFFDGSRGWEHMVHS